MEVSSLDNKFFFIVGRGRSGSTLLTRILNMHSQICVAPEGLIILYLSSKFNKRKFDTNTINSFYRELWHEKRLHEWDIDREQLKMKLHNLNHPITFQSLCKTVYRQYAIRCGKDPNIILGDKNPLYSVFINKISNLFPDAKFIHIIRDFRDNILSYKNVKFDLNNTGSLAYRWKVYNKKILKCRKYNSDRFLSIRYESLINNPSDVLKKICKFLDIDYEPNMLDFYKYQNQKLKVWHTNLRKPLNKNSINKWKKQMNDTDKLASWKICRSIAKEFDYRVETITGNKKLLIIISIVYGTILGSILSLMERCLFLLPRPLYTMVINIYRTFTGALKYAGQK